MPHSVSFVYPEPAYVDSYRQAFSCPIEFNAPANRFTLGLEVLQQPLLQANAISAELGRKMCHEFMSNQERSSQEVTRQVTELLLSGAGHMPGMEGSCQQTQYE